MARNLGVKQLEDTLKPLASSRVRIPPPANPIQANPNSKRRTVCFMRVVIYADYKTCN